MHYRDACLEYQVSIKKDPGRLSRCFLAISLRSEHEVSYCLFAFPRAFGQWEFARPPASQPCSHRITHHSDPLKFSLPAHIIPVLILTPIFHLHLHPHLPPPPPHASILSPFLPSLNIDPKKRERKKRINNNAIADSPTNLLAARRSESQHRPPTTAAPFRNHDCVSQGLVAQGRVAQLCGANVRRRPSQLARPPFQILHD